MARTTAPAPPILLCVEDYCVVERGAPTFYHRGDRVEIHPDSPSVRADSPYWVRDGAPLREVHAARIALLGTNE